MWRNLLTKSIKKAGAMSYNETQDSQQAQRNCGEKKILAELCSFPLMNAHYQKYRLTLTVS